MTNREMFLLATSILFASTTAGLALQGTLRPHHPPFMERPHGGPDGKPRPHFDMFTKSDTNADGVVTKDEMLARQQARLEEFFTTADTNGDGKLTKEEMDKGRELMRAKWKARFEAERKAPAAEATTTPAPAMAPTPVPTTAPTTAQ